jgi:hypothetical protein
MTDTKEAEVQAQKATDRWLAFIDQGDAAQAWEHASSTFRGAISVAKWEASLESAQAMLGRPVARKLESARYTTELPGAPDGAYVVLTYRTEFERKQNGIETVVPALDGDAWKVSGYFVK